VGRGGSAGRFESVTSDTLRTKESMALANCEKARRIIESEWE